MKHPLHVTLHLGREPMTALANGCSESGEGGEEMKLGDNRLWIGLHDVEILHAGPEVDAPELVFLLVSLDPIRQLWSLHPLL